jgi:hypothetical protein
VQRLAHALQEKFELLVSQKTHKFGVLFVKRGQTEESQIMQNTQTSNEFEIFLQTIGAKIELQGFKGYKGGLDVRRNMTGTHSYFTSYKGALIPRSLRAHRQTWKSCTTLHR